MRFETFMQQMTSYARAAQIQRELDIEGTKQYLRSRGYTDTEIERLNFSKPSEE